MTFAADRPMLSRSPIPMYHQLKELVLEKIESGEWSPGHKLPTEAELSYEYGVSRITVRHAMQLLQNQGLLERKQGRGTFVAQPKVAHDLTAMYRDGLTVKEMGRQPQLQLVGLELKKPAASVAAKLNLPVSDKVYEMKRLLLGDNEPLMLIASWLPAARFPDFPDHELDSRTMGSVMREYGIMEAFQHKEVEVTLLDEEEAALLQTTPGAPALLLTYVNYLPNGEPIEFRRTHVRGDRCKYYIDVDKPELQI
jgi:GntR family transcriptional regulator